MSARKTWLMLALAATVIAAFWPAREDDTGSLPVVQAVRRDAKTPKSAEALPDAPPPVASAAGRDMERFPTAKPGNLFPRQTWAPPPKPQPKPKPQVALPPPPPPAPKPPPLPFTYLGSWTERGQKTFFLAQGDRVLPVHEGQTLASQWRLDAVKPDELVFTYLPLDMTQTLRIAP